MSLISKPNTFSAGQTIIASQHNSNFDTIYSDYNGSISNANISATADIAGSKIASLAGSKLTSLASITSAAGIIPTDNMPDIANAVIDSSPDSHTASGIKVVLTSSVTVAFGDVCYINTAGTLNLIKATGTTSMAGVAMCADNSVSAGSSGTFLLHGIAADASWSFNTGKFVYGTTAGTTGNTLTQTAPAGTNEVVQILGVATAATKIYFAPSLSQVEHT